MSEASGRQAGSQDREIEVTPKLIEAGMEVLRESGIATPYEATISYPLEFSERC